MSQVPLYAARIARLPRAFERLAAHPDGLPLADLAAELGVPAAELRDDLLAFYTADVSADWLLGLTRPDVLEFLGPDGSDVDPAEAEIVRFVEETGELGVEYVDAAELALVHTAALALLDLEPDNADLAGALEVLTETLLGTPGDVPRLADRNRSLPLLQEARESRRAARIVYSRAWQPGVSEREIDPYRLVQTRRGWEVDAGPPDEHGRLRTYLLSNIREVTLLDREFVVPEELGEVLAAQRATTTVRVLLPQEARWAADFYAEQVTLVQDDEESVVVDVDLLPPLERRVGQLLLAAGPTAFVIEPPALENAGVVLAEELLLHHSA
ncbi:WYL domain-containing protein [Pimelobacter simplex]|uniref:WYL domain-containing protein n=1 Tax=Nocardioides simplex TaxID=2045 RepID=UPI00215045EF|nr:WYL domain-containing protein [Pimelobacter simplex]UUW92658.1 WYL domain-containing protein [Pimelobacter simplex]UUW96485.1 WYL domain-containing protein [Pimelobacter simplex]